MSDILQVLSRGAGVGRGTGGYVAWGCLSVPPVMGLTSAWTLQQGSARRPPCGAVRTVGPPLSGHRPVTLGRHRWRLASSAPVMRQLTHTVGLDSVPCCNLRTYCAPGPDLGTGVQPAGGPVPVPAHLSRAWGADTLPFPQHRRWSCDLWAGSGLSPGETPNPVQA